MIGATLGVFVQDVVCITSLQYVFCTPHATACLVLTCNSMSRSKYSLPASEPGYSNDIQTGTDLAAKYSRIGKVEICQPSGVPSYLVSCYCPWHEDEVEHEQVTGAFIVS